ncbi:MAG: four helix bundle protein [Chloroflexota bacterium]
MINTKSEKPFDLQQRTFEFAKGAVSFCRALGKAPVDRELAEQLLRSATSVGANYIEANEALSKKDFMLRIKTCRKEAKENAYWLKLVSTPSADMKRQRASLLAESNELVKIFSAIIVKTE